MNKRRRPQFKDFIKVIQQEQHSYKDPITEFLACVYVNYDFDGAQKKMRECEEVSSIYIYIERNTLFYTYSGWFQPLQKIVPILFNDAFHFELFMITKV